MKVGLFIDTWFVTITRKGRHSQDGEEPETD